MAQTSAGAMKAAARNAGMTVEDFVVRSSTEKRCSGCKEWRPRDGFARDASRRDGLSAKCFGCSRVKIRVDRRGRPSPLKGKTYDAETRSRMGRRPGFVSEKRGRPRTLEERAAISVGTRAKALRGPDCPSYIDGKSKERKDLRQTPEGRAWRFDVMSRDNFTCQAEGCGDSRGGNLHAHHIKPFATHPELRLDVSNGLTLCKPCHKALHRRLKHGLTSPA